MFVDRLWLELSLSVGSDTHSVLAGAIRDLRLSAKTYGFDATVSFVVSAERQEDKLFAKLSSPAPATARLSIGTRAPHDDSSDADRSRAVFSGVVVARRVAEIASDELEGSPIVERRYTVVIADHAAALWREHKPFELYADQSMKQVLTLNKAGGMHLRFDWPRLDETLRLICVPLRGDRAPSFYDFVVWYIHAHGGVLEHDAATATYRIAGRKSRGLPRAVLDGESVASIRILPIEPPRFTRHVLNASSLASRNESILNLRAHQGARRDAIVRTPITTSFERRVELERAKGHPGDHRVEVGYHRTPSRLPSCGDFVTFAETLGKNVYVAGNTYRAVGLSLGAHMPPKATEEELDEPSARFDVELSSIFEIASNPVPSLPDFRRPEYPVHVEGRVLSASGGDDDRTWFAAVNDNDALTQYRCEIPLFNVKIGLPFQPATFPGHLFFPSYKRERVLVELDFAEARIVRFLDWAAEARLPSDTQGDQMVLGMRDGNMTIVRHAYDDGKPTLRVQRKLGGDRQTIDVSEGTVRFEVKEDPTAPKVEPRYDVTPHVEAAKDRIAGEVRASLGVVTAKFESASSGVTTKVDSSAEEVAAAVKSAQATLTGKIGAVRAQLESLASSAADAVQTVAAKVAAAKAAIVAALTS